MFKHRSTAAMSSGGRSPNAAFEGVTEPNDGSGINDIGEKL